MSGVATDIENLTECEKDLQSQFDGLEVIWEQLKLELRGVMDADLNHR